MMGLLDGPLQIIILLVVFCCPIIPAGGWCWLKSIECCLQCLGAIVRSARKYAYVPMYLCLLGLLVAGLTMVTEDFLSVPNRTYEQRQAFYLFLGTAALALLTICISVVSTLKCLKGQLSITEQRERTVYILALPAFYCLMCFLSAQQLLTYTSGTVEKHWSWNMDFKSSEETLKFTMDMVTFYMSAADVFEAFAFTTFGMLTMESLRRSAQYTDREGDREARLHNCIQNWTMSPIYMFCMVLFAESIYRFIDVFSKYFHLASMVPPALTHALDRVPWPSEDVTNMTFFTLTSVFSSLAIMALFSIEHVFHDDLVSVQFVDSQWKRFRFLANLKFWGVKIFVTVEFFLDVAMTLVHMEDVKKQLLFTACMATLCFLVSILHMRAYNSNGRPRWIRDTEDSQAQVRTPLWGEDTDSAFASQSSTSLVSGVSMQPNARSGARALLPENAESASASKIQSSSGNMPP